MYIVVVRMDIIVLTCFYILFVYTVIDYSSIVYYDGAKRFVAFSVMYLGLEYEEWWFYVFLCAMFRKELLGNGLIEIKGGRVGGRG